MYTLNRQTYEHVQVNVYQGNWQEFALFLTFIKIKIKIYSGYKIIYMFIQRKTLFTLEPRLVQKL